MDFTVVNNFLEDVRDLNDFDVYTSHWMHKISTLKPLTYFGSKRKRFNPFVELKEDEFKQKYRFTKDNMRKIIDLVHDDLEADSYSGSHSSQVPVKLQIMAAIRFWGGTEHSEITAATHGITTKTLAKICRRVSAALASKASRYIRMPSTLAEKEKVTNAFQAISRMPQVIGALSYMSVRLQRSSAELEQKTSTIGNEGNVHIQVVSDASFKIRDLDCKLRSFGEKNNACEMFTQSRIKERLEQNEFRGRVLIGDDRLSSSIFMFTPVRWPMTPKEQAFNQSHAIILSTVNTCLDLWRKRFGILDYEISASCNTAKHTIVALALLHNMAIDWNDNEDRLISIKTIKALRQETLAQSEFIKTNF